jgi:alcohol dehydrogenase class IV
VIPFDHLLKLSRHDTELWVDPAVRARVTDVLPFRVGRPADVAPGTTRLLVVGGGTLLDIAKAWRADRSPATGLIAVPSIWGSGAEMSPVVVLNEEGRKAIRMDDRFLPDQVVYWPELAESLPDDLARAACGDCWSHALEGFLSPLAEDTLRDEIAGLMRRMLEHRIGNDPAWFGLGGEACAAQARSSVGLVHGLAHTLEGPLRARFPDAGWGHAKLCSVFLWPVLAFNSQSDAKATRLMAQHGVNVDDVVHVAQQLHDSQAYQSALPFLAGNWRSILRDPCTRTNVRLVRPADLEFFERWDGV